MGNRYLVLPLCAVVWIAGAATGCASRRTTATGGTATATSGGTSAGVTPRTDNTGAAGTQSTETRRDSLDRLNEAATVFQEIMQAPDKGIPQDLLDKAQCVVVVPGLKKGAFIVGAQYGKGYFSCRQKDGTGWTAPASVRVEGGSFGFQIGGSETDVVMLIMNERGEDRLLSSQFTVGGDASVAAGPVGRTAEAKTDAYMTAEILSWSRSRGAFAGIALNGATVREDVDDNESLYGRRLSNRDIIQGAVRAPAAAQQFLSVLNQHSPRKAG